LRFNSKTSEMTSMKHNFLILVCHVAAPDGFASNDHVERLISGRFPGAGPGLGIGAMMDIADGFGVKMSFLIDTEPENTHGESVAQAAKRIQERGHDLQQLSDESVLSDLAGFRFEDFPSSEAMHEHLRGLWSKSGESNAACLQFNSWSLLHRNDQGIPIYKGQENANRLREFFRYIPREVQVVTASELQRKIESGEIQLSAEQP